MAGKGGYQPPASPAPVSGPGRLSKRTDGQAVRPITGLEYGANQELNTQQAAAPMSGTTVGTGQPGAAPPMVGLAEMSPNLYAPTDRPQEPVSAGAASGPGPGPEALGPARLPDGPSKARMMALLPVMSRAAEQPYASDELRAIVALMRTMNA